MKGQCPGGILGSAIGRPAVDRLSVYAAGLTRLVTKEKRIVAVTFAIGPAVPRSKSKLAIMGGAADCLSAHGPILEPFASPAPAHRIDSVALQPGGCQRHDALVGSC